MSYVNATSQSLTKILTDARTIAVVGASSNPDRPSYQIARRLLDVGYRMIPVNPKETEVHGQRAFGSLDAIREPVDIVVVFRRSAETPAIADQAVALHAKLLWLQPGVSNEDAAERAETAGLTVVMDKCIMAMHIALQIPRKPVLAVSNVAA